MKKYILLTLSFFSFSMYSQVEVESENINLNELQSKSAQITEIKLYHDNGNIYQTGSLKNNKLHGRWESYDINGNLSVVGEFLRGKKQGKWFFWTTDKFIEVNFKNNKIQNHFEWDKAINSIAVRTN